MISRKLVLPVLLATAAGTPYLLMEYGVPSVVRDTMGTLVSTDASRVEVERRPERSFPHTVGSEYDFGPQAANPDAVVHPGVAGPPVEDLGEVLRFDIHPDWVSNRWPRVTLALSEPGLTGLRVPLVTGIRVDDVAGSLTYFFGPDHRLQRLTLEGFTGDAHRLVQLVTEHYGLKPEATLHAGMYVARWNKEPTSVLRITRPPVTAAASPHARLQVLLELNRPAMAYGLSTETRKILEYDRQTQQW